MRPIQLAAVTLLLHLAANPHYGFFRDELYFIVCGRHPAWGYVDQPPLVPLLAAASQAAGTSLVLLRALPALAAAATVWLAARLAARLGAGRFGVTLAGLATLLSPVLSAFGARLGPDTLQAPLWTAIVLCLAHALANPRWLPLAGLLLGLATEAKYSALFLAAGLATGLAATPHRRLLVRPPAWAAAAIAAALIAPNALWQWHHHWPMLELLRNGQNGKNVAFSPAGFLLALALMANPLFAALALAGLARCLARAEWRWLGIACTATIALILALHGKPYYPAPILPTLFAAGGAALQHRTRPGGAARPALLALAATGALLLPLTLPILPEPALLAYLRAAATLGIAPPAMENHRRPRLGQDFADMHGWPALARQVAAIHAALPAPLRARTWIFASNYGEAAAIDVLAPPGLPPALSGHNQYFLWGPRGWDGTALIDIGGNLDIDRKLCTDAQLAGTFRDPYVMPYENDLPIILCLGLRMPVAAIWPSLKHYE